MPIPAIENLIDGLRTTGLLDAPQLHELVRSHEARLTDPNEFGETMLRLGWLTPYQVAELLAGRGGELVLGQYLLLDRLGEGGMGIVYKARHRNLGRVVAVKVLRKDRLANPEAAARFRREIELASQLSHPNIVLAFDADHSGESHFFVMEYIEGIDLANLVRKSGPMGVSQACDYVRQAALGLQHAHERGLVHRDIKPSNLILQRTKGTRNGDGASIKILDLGLARLQYHLDADDNSRLLTREGGVVGTVDFMAPEQADNAHTVDIRADLYSLGCTFYYLLTRNVLFPGTSTAEKIFKHRYEPPPPLLRVRPEIPPAVVTVVYRLLAKRPENRFRTPAELAEMLAALPPPAAVPLALPIEAREPEPLALPLAIPIEAQPAVLPQPTPEAQPAATGDMWSLSESTPTMAAIPKSNPVSQAGAVAFTHSGKRVVASRPDGSVRLWDLTGAEPREEAILVGHRDHVVALAFTPDDATFFSGGADGRVIWWGAATHRRLREWQFPHPVVRAALAPDGGHIAIMVENGATYILRLAPAEETPVNERPGNGVR